MLKSPPARALLAALCVAALGSVTTPTFAETDYNHAVKVNVSGKQRMLSQRMARAVCFETLGIQPARHQTMGRYAKREFELALEGLYEGDWMLGTRPEDDQIVQEKLAFVQGIWGPYRFALDAARKESSALQRVADQSVPVLKASHAVVMALVESGTRAFAPGEREITNLVNISGRQRMLTQRAAKEFCFVVAGVNVEENAESLRATIDLFDSSLYALQNGDRSQGLLPPPDQLVRHQLAVPVRLVVVRSHRPAARP